MSVYKVPEVAIMVVCDEHAKASDFELEAR